MPKYLGESKDKSKVIKSSFQKEGVEFYVHSYIFGGKKLMGQQMRTN